MTVPPRLLTPEQRGGRPNALEVSYWARRVVALNKQREEVEHSYLGALARLREALSDVEEDEREGEGK